LFLKTDGAGNLSFDSLSFSTPLAVIGNATAGSEIRLPEDTDNGSNYVALKAPDTLASDLTLTLPSADGSSGQVLQTNGSGVLSFAGVSASAGQVIQVVTATETTLRSTSSSSFVTGSNTLSVSITPSSASNKVFVVATFNIGMSSTTHTGAVTIFRGATDLGSGGGGMSYIKGIGDDGVPASVSVLDSPSTTSATTYQIYFKNASGGTTYLSQGKSSITAFEVKG
jgi:hypothetical protein